MKNTLIYLFFLFVITTQKSFGQYTHFTNHGIIEFEKTVNMFALLKPKDGNTFQQMYYEKYKSTKPQFVTLKSNLIFDTQKSLFTPVWDDNDKVNTGWSLGSMGPQVNQIFTNLIDKNFIAKKNVLGQDYIVKDSLRKINWKITTEFRQIAGYNCRRANAIIMDSVYVVAFYTDEIPVSGGPESFTGLPGMILGVALPYEHVTWFATKVTDVSVPDKDFVIPSKGKPTTLKNLKDLILNAGDYYKQSLLGYML